MVKNLKFILPVLLIILFIILVKSKSQPNCTITSAVLNTATIDNSTANFSWTNGENSKIVYLNVSTAKSLKPDGSLEDAGIVNDIVTDKNSYSKNNLEPGTYYWNIVSDGCNERKVSKLGSFTVQSIADADSNTDCEIEPAILGTPIIKDSTAALSWTNSQNAGATYINISTSESVNDSGILQKVDIANDIVSGKTLYTREGLSSGTYYWNIASDGCGQRKVSNLGSFNVQ